MPRSASVIQVEIGLKGEQRCLDFDAEGPRCFQVNP
jgi:hypothetical protein